MKRLNKAVVVVLFIIVLVACASVGEDEVTREVVVDGETVTAVPPTTLPDTPTPTATPAPSRTPVPTDVPLPTLFATVTRTPEPTITPWPSATPRPTIDFDQELVWVDEMEVVNQFPGSQVVWSPKHNEFAYVVMTKEGDPLVFFANLLDFQPTDLTPTELLNYKILWHPSGEYFFLNAESYDFDNYIIQSPYLWKITRLGPSITEMGPSSYLWGWFNDKMLIYEARIGTGIFGIALINIETGEHVAGTNFDGYVKDVSHNYVVLGWEPWNPYTTIAILAQESISPGYEEWEFGTYIKFLASPFDNGSIKRPFNRFADILPGTDHVLVTTWEDGISEPLDLISGTVPANLQLWDVEADTLTMVAPGGIYGRYSPNGRYLVYLTPETDSLQLHLLDQTTEENLFTQTAFAEVDRDNAEVKAYTTFSPNGRFLTFFNPAHELIIYDLENGEFLAPVSAISTAILWSPDRISFLSEDVKPLWSPDSSRFVYQDPTAGLSIFDTRSAIAYPLALSGSDRLLDPQWSYDGAYLSVTVLQEAWWERETAVLQIP